MSISFVTFDVCDIELVYIEDKTKGMTINEVE